MADIDTPEQKNAAEEAAKAAAAKAAAETPEQKAAKAKTEAETAAAAAKAAKDAEADAEREAAEERRIAKAAEKLADKKVKDALAARDADAAKKAEREKMDVAEKAKAEATEATQKLAAAEERAAAAELKAELAGHLVTKSLTPANPQALGYIQAAVQRELAGGAEDVEKALAKVAKAEPFLFKVAAPATAERKLEAIDTGGKAAGGQERAAPEGAGGEQRQYKTKAPSEIDASTPAGRLELQAAIRERHGFMPTFH